jgi:hypothetical protein
MQPVLPALPAGTIPVPARVVLMRVTTHNWNGVKHATPFWHILGYRDHIDFNRRWFNQEDVTLGDQGDGDHILDVTTLGLDPTECMAYLDAEERHDDLQTEEDRYDLHSDPDGKCLCAQIAEQKAIMDLYESKITAAVNERFDAWTRRRHLVALGSALGMSAFDMPAWSVKLDALIGETTTEPAVAPVVVDASPASYWC